MFSFCSDNQAVRILGIDPGSVTLGIACLSIDPQTLEILNTQAVTFTSLKLAINPWMEQVHTPRFARIAAHKENIKYVLNYCRPVAVVCESPFYNPSRPQAYGVLVETLDAIRQAVWEYDQCIPLDLVDPPTVKQAVGGKGNADKDAMKQLVLNLPNLNFTGPIQLSALDEHSIDAIAVCWSKIMQYRSIT
jgi:Holliday junction resolvasome RuvABC endonuclease subunit